MAELPAISEPPKPKTFNAWQRGRLRARLALYRLYEGDGASPLSWNAVAHRLAVSDHTDYDDLDDPDFKREEDARDTNDGLPSPVTGAHLEQFVRGVQPRRGVREGETPTVYRERNLSNDHLAQLERFLVGNEYLEPLEMVPPDAIGDLPVRVAAFVDTAMNRGTLPLERFLQGEFVASEPMAEQVLEIELYLSRVGDANAHEAGLRESIYDKIPDKEIRDYDRDDRDDAWIKDWDWRGYGVVGNEAVQVSLGPANLKKSRRRVIGHKTLAIDWPDEVNSQVDVLRGFEIDPVDVFYTGSLGGGGEGLKNLEFRRGASVGKSPEDLSGDW